MIEEDLQSVVDELFFASTNSTSVVASGASIAGDYNDDEEGDISSIMNAWIPAFFPRMV